MTEEEFGQAARTYGDMIYRVAYHGLKNRSDAEDVMQTVLLKLIESKVEYASQDHLKHWLLRVTVNESRKLLRSFWRRTSVPLEERRDGPVLEDPEKEELFRAVMGLEAKYRLTIYLYYYEGCTVSEVAAAMKAKPSTVQTWLLRARERLRRELSQEEEKEGERYVRPQIVP
ncbi:sigma-70 family RNA polymerase sigma factor [Flavonifractor sp. An100]|uniref:RNA polymerase sigma factor n=1 Tax=Flavonifractor sp. An100 TaxID=1965538 RepID=UPI000B383E67|nr:sigma-70 family RNA polymerase sigma factor [Flavonifractor sp. An100]OUQ82388.1 RNA polymerase subunit sigma [Flavonifractor sp. An100]